MVKKYTYNYGTVEKGKAQLPTAATTFELASVTKTFTGILLARAVLDKKLKNLMDDVRKYMDGDFANLHYQGAIPSALLLTCPITPSGLPGRAAKPGYF